MRAILLSLVFIFSVLSEFASFASGPMRLANVDGEKFYIYEVKKGDTLFGIARSQQWNDSILAALNPEAIAPLKKGMLIYYPITNDSADIANDGNGFVMPHTERNVRVDVLHTLKIGETIADVASLYDVSEAHVIKLNPEVKQGYHQGMVLKIQPSGDFYVITPSDDLTKIANTYNVSVAAIFESNPGLQWDNVKEGVIIRLPQEGAGLVVGKTAIEEQRIRKFLLYSVKKDDTWQRIATQYYIDTELLKSCNPDIHALKKNQIVGVPVLEKFNLEKEGIIKDIRETSSHGIREIYNEVHHISDTPLSYETKIALVAENPASKKDSEYLRGFLAGVDKIKNDHRVNMKIINEEDGSAKVLDELNAFKPDIIISTAEKDLPGILCDYAENQHIPLINAFDVKNTEYVVNPYIIQLMSPSGIFNDYIAQYLKEKYSDFTVLFLGEAEESDQLASAIMETLGEGKYRSLSLDNLEFSRINPEGKYIFYCCDVNKEAVDAVMDKTIAAREQLPFAEIIMMGRPNLIVFEESLKSKLHQANTIMPSRFYIESSDHNYTDFQARYKKLFDRAPQRSIPLYAGVGFDNAIFFISALSSAHGDVNNLSGNNQVIQSEYALKRFAPWSGQVNTPVFLIHYTPVESIEKIQVNY